LDGKNRLSYCFSFVYRLDNKEWNKFIWRFDIVLWTGKLKRSTCKVEMEAVDDEPSTVAVPANE